MGGLASCIDRDDRRVHAPSKGKAGESDTEMSSSRSSGGSGSSCCSSSEEEQGRRSWWFPCVNSKTRDDAWTSPANLKVRSSPRAGKRQKALLVNNRGKVVDDYLEVDRKRVIGEGGYAQVLIAKEKRSGQPRAIKCITKKMIASSDRLQREIDILLDLDHPNINKLYQVFEDPRYVYMVLELCMGGELFERIQELGHLSERQAAIIMSQIFRAVFYMHGQNVVHRDLKPENFLFQHRAPIEGNTLKVIDFGIAGVLSKDTDYLTTRTGTPYYVAPEVLGFPFAMYGKPADMWSCGVVMYVLLSGRLPFRGIDDHATFQKVKSGKFSFPLEFFGSVTEGAKLLIKALLAKDAAKRYTASEAVNDTWTREQAPAAAPAPLQPHVVQAIRVFHAENKLKRVALHVVARHLDENQIKHLKNVFMELDTNGDGNLTMAELTEGLTRAHLRDSLPPDIGEIVKHMDTDGNGTVDYTEFLAATLERRHYNDESMLWSAFRVFDKNDDGRISKQELREVLSSQEVMQIAKVNAEDLMHEIDKNGDGFIDFEEFCSMMIGSAHVSVA